MEIKHKTAEEIIKTFADVNPGDSFLWNDGVYIRVHENKLVIDANIFFVNAVNLNTGWISHIQEHERVHKVNSFVIQEI